MKKVYCSLCGVELRHIRKTVPNKGHILDCIGPHECEGYAVKEAPDGKKTVLQILDALKPVSGFQMMAEETKPTTPNIEDKREGIEKSSNPTSRIKNMLNLPTDALLGKLPGD